MHAAACSFRCCDDWPAASQTAKTLADQAPSLAKDWQAPALLAATMPAPERFAKMP